MNPIESLEKFMLDDLPTTNRPADLVEAHTVGFYDGHVDGPYRVQFSYGRKEWRDVQLSESAEPLSFASRKLAALWMEAEYADRGFHSDCWRVVEVHDELG